MKVGGINSDQLRSIIERVEKLEEEKAAISSDISEIFSEAKGNGYDPKILKQILKIRKMEKSEREEHETMLDLYLRALGMAPDYESDGDSDD